MYVTNHWSKTSEFLFKVSLFFPFHVMIRSFPFYIIRIFNKNNKTNCAFSDVNYYILFLKDKVQQLLSFDTYERSSALLKWILNIETWMLVFFSWIASFLYIFTKKTFGESKCNGNNDFYFYLLFLKVFVLAHGCLVLGNVLFR